MAKTQAATTIPPEVFTTSQGIYTDDVTDVIEVHNMAWGYGVAAVLAGQLSGFLASPFTAVGPHEVTFPASAGYSRRYRGRLWIDPDTDNLELRTVVTMPAANTGRVRITIGATNSVHTHSAGATTTTTSTLATSATGTGLVSFEVEVDHQTGASTSCTLDEWLIQGQAVTSALPSPVE